MKKTILKQNIFHATNHMNLNIFANTEGVTSIFVIPLMVVKGIEMNCQIVKKKHHVSRDIRNDYLQINSNFMTPPFFPLLTVELFKIKKSCN